MDCSVFQDSEIARLQAKLASYDRGASQPAGPLAAVDVCRGPTDTLNRLGAVYSGPRPRSASPTPRGGRVSDISKITEESYAQLPTITDRLSYLDIDDRRQSLQRIFDRIPLDMAADVDVRQTDGRKQPASRHSAKNNKKQKSRRESRSDVSGIYTASEDESGEENDPDSFVVMLREVNYRFNKNKRDMEEVKNGNPEAPIDRQSLDRPVIRIPSQFDED